MTSVACCRVTHSIESPDKIQVGIDLSRDCCGVSVMLKMPLKGEVERNAGSYGVCTCFGTVFLLEPPDTCRKV